MNWIKITKFEDVPTEFFKPFLVTVKYKKADNDEFQYATDAAWLSIQDGKLTWNTLRNWINFNYFEIISYSELPDPDKEE